MIMVADAVHLRAKASDARIHNQEFDGHVYLCTGPRHPWGQMWPQLRSYS